MKKNFAANLLRNAHWRQRHRQLLAPFKKLKTLNKRFSDINHYYSHGSETSSAYNEPQSTNKSVVDTSLEHHRYCQPRQDAYERGSVHHYAINTNDLWPRCRPIIKVTRRQQGRNGPRPASAAPRGATWNPRGGVAARRAQGLSPTTLRLPSPNEHGPTSSP